MATNQLEFESTEHSLLGCGRASWAESPALPTSPVLGTQGRLVRARRHMTSSFEGAGVAPVYLSHHEVLRPGAHWGPPTLRGSIPSKLL